MSFNRRIADTYSIVIGKHISSLSEPFEMDNQVAEFMAAYDLWDEVDAVSTAKLSLVPPPKALKYPLGTQLKLKSHVQKELDRTYNLFTSQKYADERMERTKAGTVSDVNKLIQKVAKSLKVEPRGITVDVDFKQERHGGYTWGGTITVKYKGTEIEYQPSGLYYQDGDGQIGEAMNDHSWAAWLGHDDSPFHNDGFIEGYEYDQMSQWMHEAGSIEGDADQLEAKIKSLILTHEEGDQEEAARHYKSERNRRKFG